MENENINIKIENEATTPSAERDTKANSNELENEATATNDENDAKANGSKFEPTSFSLEKEPFRIKNARFVISVADPSKMPDIEGPEIAIAGKSNVGKSSFLNFITNQKKLARTSGDPGRTRLLNYFEINNGELHFVDLPGYGYAKVSKSEQEKWGGMIEGYLTSSKNLRNVFVLLDVRHEPSADDKMLLSFLQHHLIDFSVIATKCDKLSRMQMNNMKRKIANSLAIGTGNIILTSSLKRIGETEVFERIAQILDK